MEYALIKKSKQIKRMTLFKSKSLRSVMRKLVLYGGDDIEFIATRDVQKILILLFRSNQFIKLQRIVESMNRNNWSHTPNKMWLINNVNGLEEFILIDVNYPNLEEINESLITVGLSEYEIIKV